MPSPGSLPVPIYEYRCDVCEAQFEVMQRMSDDPLEVCERCGGHLSKVLHPVAIHFKGSGFYTTDYGRGSKGRQASQGAESASGSNGESAAEPVKAAAKSSEAVGDGSADKHAKAKTPASS
jgi:putative FmdB family regulatory protein